MPPIPKLPGPPRRRALSGFDVFSRRAGEIEDGSPGPDGYTQDGDEEDEEDDEIPEARFDVGNHRHNAHLRWSAMGEEEQAPFLDRARELNLANGLSPACAPNDDAVGEWPGMTKVPM